MDFPKNNSDFDYQAFIKNNCDFDYQAFLKDWKKRTDAWLAKALQQEKEADELMQRIDAARGYFRKML